MTSIAQPELLDKVIHLARDAGKAILDIYDHIEGFDVTSKADDSPVTAADLAAHQILKPGLEKLQAGVPVLSEEAKMPGYAVRKTWSRYWIIDPLDGTKEFIKRNGEFTVNIALIENGRPVMGVVYVPVLDLLYTGIHGVGAWKTEKNIRKKIATRSMQQTLDKKIPVAVVASRSHGAEAVDRFLARISSKLGAFELKNMGSSLKLCLVAEGQADIYPRLALTSEWDTAAAQAVVEAAGGQVLDINLNVLSYNTKEDILNPFFFVIGDPLYPWAPLLQES